MEKLRVIDRWHPGFLRCILDLAAESVVGISSGGGNLVQRALKLMKARKMKIQKPARVLNLKIILSDNGLDQDKRDKFEKYHPGFSDCVLQTASNPDSTSTMYGYELQKRAKRYLKNKRQKAGIDKQDKDKDIKEAIRGCVSSLMELLGQEETYFGSGEFKERYKPQVKKGSVSNNCSFETNPMSKVLFPAV